MKVNDSLIRTVLHNSIQFAIEKHEYVTTEHILYFATKVKEIEEFLESIKPNSAKEIRDAIEEIWEKYYTPPPPLKFPGIAGEMLIPGITEKSIEILERILIKTMNSDENDNIPAWRFIDEIIKSETLSAEILKDVLGMEEEEFDKLIKEKYSSEDVSGDSLNISMTLDEAKKIIAKYTSLLNEEVENMTPVIGRDREIFEINKTLGRKTKNNVLLVGDAGVGKTAIVNGLVQKYVRNEVPRASNLANSKVFSLNISSLLAGTKYRGELEERIDNIIKAFVLVGKKEKEKYILFIDEVHMLIGAGTSSENRSMDIANLLKPALTTGYLKVIGATTTEEFRKYLEKDSAFLRRFHVIPVNEPSESDTIKIIEGLIKHFEKHHNVSYDKDSIEASVYLSKKFIKKNKLPDKAIDVIDAAGSKNNLIKDRVNIITKDKIIEEISFISKIPVEKIKEEKNDKIKNLEKELKKRIFGQDHAIETVVNSIYIAHAGLKDGNKPDSVFMFNGPTGTGKTEVAKSIAELLDMNFIRIDMSEYMEKHSVSKLIGAPPGYVGFDDGKSGNGMLINEIEENPFSVVLFDEVEKAHPDVWNILLQIMDYGYLTSSAGKKVSFSDSIIILTSNIGSRYVGKKEIGFTRESVGEEIQEEMVKSTLPPELINRIDHIITFKHLSNEVIDKIIDKFIKELSDKVKNKNITLTLTNKAKEFLRKEGYSLEYGARFMKRVIDKHIKFKLAPLILFDENTDKDTKNIIIDFDGNEIFLEKNY